MGKTSGSKLLVLTHGDTIRAERYEELVAGSDYIVILSCIQLSNTERTEVIGVS